jgi:GST-like protein
MIASPYHLSRPKEISKIDVHYWPTPNGWKVTIMLEECGLEYGSSLSISAAAISSSPNFLRISPNNRMPAIVDNDPVGGGAPISIFESGAILEYLGDKSGKFLPTTPRERYACCSGCIGRWRTWVR